MNVPRFCFVFFTTLAFILAAAPAETPSAASTGTPARRMQPLARRAVDDLLRHFWVGDENTGHVLNTSHGVAESLRDPRGALWERAMVIYALDNASQALGDAAYARRVQADWRQTKSAFTPAELEACGLESRTNWASDDAGWSALMYLIAYRVTGDRDALDRARGLVNHAFDRWLDGQLGGGMWYSDQRDTKSLYQASIVLAALQIWEITGEASFHDRALGCYTWIEEHLLRPDGLYWCNYDPSGPVGANRPDDIHEAGSVVFLGGSMAMGVIHARLFRITGDDRYRLRAIRTADGLRAKLVTDQGIYLDDRDASTNAAFAGEWAREVLTLPGIGDQHRKLLRATAESIYENARTADGYYGASWSGPAEGPGSRWFSKPAARIHGPKTPQQLMTSANSVNMIVAAAALETAPREAAPPAPPAQSEKAQK